MSKEAPPLITIGDLTRILGECAERDETSSEWVDRKRIDSEALSTFITNSEQSLMAMVVESALDNTEGGPSMVDFGELIRAALCAMFQVGWECSTQFRQP